MFLSHVQVICVVKYNETFSYNNNNKNLYKGSKFRIKKCKCKKSQTYASHMQTCNVPCNVSEDRESVLMTEAPIFNDIAAPTGKQHKYTKTDHL